ncbi:AzlC family ABC transporter permease [Staphylospora marina]|uniref:AzlC family ABC transporter permease n=1 Tax=Staphylospora marina TaxID=2490858 RepID=UPI001F153ECF|nr:AzlC family ABC transporter permease [Staphylospora marina]
MHAAAWDKHGFGKGVKAAVPIVVGYVPIAMAFGMIAVQGGLAIPQAVAMSFFVYAGASQFMAVQMLTGHVAALEIVIATLVLNFRHFVMSLALMNRFEGIGARWRIPVSLGITDETFAIASLGGRDARKGDGTEGYLAGLFVTAHASWVLGTWAGGALAEVIPESVSSGMVIALYAMFIGLLVPAARENPRGGVVAVAGMLLSTLFAGVVPSGWAKVLSIVVGAMAGIWLFKRGDGRE